MWLEFRFLNPKRRSKKGWEPRSSGEGGKKRHTCRMAAQTRHTRGLPKGKCTIVQGRCPNGKPTNSTTHQGSGFSGFQGSEKGVGEITTKVFCKIPTHP